MPEDPTAKEKQKADSVNHDQVRKVAALMVAGGATVMALSLLVLYCLLTFTNFTANPNIILTKEQLDHLLFFILVPLYVVVLLGSAGFYRNYNQERIFCCYCCCWNFFRQMPCCILSSRSLKILTTTSILLLTLAALVPGFVLLPAGPSRVHVVLKPTNGGHGLVLSAFTENALLDNDTCVRNEDKIKCGEFSLEIVDFDTTSINKITATATGYHDANIFVSEDLSEYCLKCRDKKDKFCHRMVHEAAKLQQRVIWSNWSEWSKCTSVCGSSSRTRTRTYELEGEGRLCLGPRTETEKCGKPACKKYKFLTEDEVPRSVTKVLGTFEERSEQFEGRPSFKQKETKLQDGVFLLFDPASAEIKILGLCRVAGQPPGPDWLYLYAGKACAEESPKHEPPSSGGVSTQLRGM